jgi:hypothetical protein
MKQRIFELLRRVTRIPGAVYRRSKAILIQIASLVKTGAMSSSKVVLFLVPGEEFISGGILSIFNLYRFSCDLTAVHNSKVLMCYYPGQGKGKWRYQSVDGSITIYPFWLILATCLQLTHMQLHVPNAAVPEVVKRLGRRRLARLRLSRGLKINILNQNILHNPPDAFIESLREQLPELTCTTAHPSYSTMEFRRKWGIPVHYLPVWTYPNEPVASGYEEKLDLLIVSRDPSPHREAVLRKISTALPKLQMQVIENMPFEEYLNLAQQAKWSLTFGEGLDDYFTGTFFRGGVGFAVFNLDFFTGEFEGLRTVFPSWESLAANIIREIESLDNKEAMESYSAQVRLLLTRYWSSDRTKTALREFYQGVFTLP